MSSLYPECSQYSSGWSQLQDIPEEPSILGPWDAVHVLDFQQLAGADSGPVLSHIGAEDEGDDLVATEALSLAASPALQQTGKPALLAPSLRSSSKHIRKQGQNRQAQQRFRQRRKVRT